MVCITYLPRTGGLIMEEEDIRPGRRGEFCVEKWPRGRWKYYDGSVFRFLTVINALFV